MTMTPNDFIDEMIDVIQEQGWCQHAAVNPQGNVCIVGAHDRVFGRHYNLQTDDKRTWEDDLNVSIISESALNAIRDVIWADHGLISIPSYNDTIAKSAEDVILILKKAKME